MVLTANFWYEFEKNDIDEFVEKIISDEIFITIAKPNKVVFVSYCNYLGNNPEEFVNGTIQLINETLEKLQIKNLNGFDWAIRVIDRPNNLCEILKKLKFTKIVSVLKMGIDLFDYKFNFDQKNFEFKIAKVNGEEFFNERMLEIFQENNSDYFKNIDQVEFFLKNRILVHEKLGNNLIQFNAYLSESQIPIAYGSMVIEKKLPTVAYLNGAATDKNYRNKGIYSNLLFKRINYAKEMGVQYIVIDADELTSAPILEKYGFKTFDKYDIYHCNL